MKEADYRDAAPSTSASWGFLYERDGISSIRIWRTGPVVAIVNETLARRYFPEGSDPIGQRLRLSSRLLAEIVGIVWCREARRFRQQSTSTVYASYLQLPEVNEPGSADGFGSGRHDWRRKEPSCWGLFSSPTITSPDKYCR